jgi:hypothetical protein
MALLPSPMQQPRCFIQADEIRAKGRKIIVWIALAMDVTTRLWLAGAVSEHRDRTLIDLLLPSSAACGRIHENTREGERVCIT